MAHALKNASAEVERVVKKELTDSEASCLLTTFSSQALLIANGQFKDRDISSLYMRIQRMVKTATKSTLISEYTFDGLVPMAFGQGDTVLQYAFRGSDLYCAKIGNPLSIQREVEMAERVHKDQKCPSIMPVIDSLRISETRLAMIVPFYPLPLSHTVVQENTVVNMALCALATVKGFSSKNLCHGDMKPSNMMFQASNRIVVTIDFGSCVEYGETISATSPMFGLDCPIEGSLQYDLTCVATSIIFLLGNELDQFRTRDDVKSWLASRHGMHYTIASLCLGETDSVDPIWEKCKQLATLMHSDAAWIVDLDTIWPAPAHAS
jgi:serine/threonine protein kinase